MKEVRLRKNVRNETNLDERLVSISYFRIVARGKSKCGMQLTLYR